VAETKNQEKRVTVEELKGLQFRNEVLSNKIDEIGRLSAERNLLNSEFQEYVRNVLDAHGFSFEEWVIDFDGNIILKEKKEGGK